MSMAKAAKLRQGCQRSGKTNGEDWQVLYSSGLSVIPDFPPPPPWLPARDHRRGQRRFYCEILSEQHSEGTEGWASIGPERHKQS